jgi:hypothetical protein
MGLQKVKESSRTVIEKKFFSVWRSTKIIIYEGTQERSVADPGCFSRIPDPDFYPSRIPDLGSDPKTATKDRGGKKFFVKPFFVATNFTKLNIILFLIC